MSTAMNTTTNPSAEQIKALQTLEQSIRKLLNSFGVDGSALSSAPEKKKRAKKSATTAVVPDVSEASDAEAKPKREINPKIAAMNEERKLIFASMKEEWSTANPTFASMSKEELKKAISEGQVSKPPGYPDALREHSKRMGEKDPEHAKRTAAKRLAADEKKSQRSDASSDAKLNDAASDASAPTTAAAAKKKRGPKKLGDMTPEELAVHQAKKAAKKALTATAVAAPVVVSQINAEVITGDDDDPETLVPWSFQGKDYFKNEIGFVYEMVSPSEPGAYVGRFGLVKGKRGIDTTVPEPEDN